jgi:hypothetical protein
MMRTAKLIALAAGLALSITACEGSGYGPTHSYSARYGTNGTAADATANNGSVSTSVEAQRQKVYNNYGY